MRKEQIDILNGTVHLQRAALPHFSLYELRCTFATRLNAGGCGPLRDANDPSRGVRRI